MRGNSAPLSGSGTSKRAALRKASDYARNTATRSDAARVIDAAKAADILVLFIANVGRSVHE